MSAATEQRYRTPSVSRNVSVSLDEFSNNEIAEYLRHRGFRVAGNGRVGRAGGAADPFEDGLLIEAEELAHLNTLALCGQRESAREWLIELVSREIGRQL